MAHENTSSGFLLPTLIGLSSVLAIVIVYLFIQVRTMQTKWRVLLDESNGRNVENLLVDHLRQRTELQEQVFSLQKRVNDLEYKMLRSKRFVGVVRYDAFDDVGGSQSFALAMYDDQGNGAIVTSLVGRMDCRVYCKPLFGGKSDRSLSQEETDAILNAQKASAGES